MTPKQEVQARVSRHFDCDHEKIAAWWKASNPLLGDTTPERFAAIKGFDVLLKHVKNWQEGNMP